MNPGQRGVVYGQKNGVEITKECEVLKLLKWSSLRIMMENITEELANFGRVPVFYNLSQDRSDQASLGFAVQEPWPERRIT